MRWMCFAAVSTVPRDRNTGGRPIGSVKRTLTLEVIVDVFTADVQKAHGQNITPLIRDLAKRWGVSERTGWKLVGEARRQRVISLDSDALKIARVNRGVSIDDIFRDRTPTQKKRRSYKWQLVDVYRLLEQNTLSSVWTKVLECKGDKLAEVTEIGRALSLATQSEKQVLLARLKAVVTAP